MKINRIYKGLVSRLNRLGIIPRKLTNTAYYALSNKDNFIVINAPLFQFMNKIKSFNIGDDLNFYLVSQLTGKKVIAYWAFYHSKQQSSIMAIGSVIDQFGNRQSTVWGSGILLPPHYCGGDQQYKDKVGDVLAVRGKKTRSLLLNSGIKCPEVYGDPALLMPYIYRPQIKPVSGRIGFIPHYVDLNDGHFERLIHEAGENALLIRVQNYKNWEDVINQICSCEFIISSSLHGLILSDAYGISNLWVTLPKALPGGGFKFEDYYSAVGKEPYPFKIGESTCLADLIEKKKYYQPINFDPRPLLKACPFEIVHPSIKSLLGGQFSD